MLGILVDYTVKSHVVMFKVTTAINTISTCVQLLSITTPSTGSETYMKFKINIKKVYIFFTNNQKND